MSALDINKKIDVLTKDYLKILNRLNDGHLKIEAFKTYYEMLELIKVLKEEEILKK